VSRTELDIQLAYLGLKCLILLGQCADQASRNTLQEDVTKLYNWSQDWQMDFNVEKCKVMHIGRSNPEYQYLMNSHVLQEVKQEKDLGIMITSDLKSFSQVTEAYKKANRAPGMISRSIQYKSKSILLCLLKTLVRPHLEYCTQIWSPHYSKDKQLLEKVQHRFTRMVPGMKVLPYNERLRLLGLWTLEERQNTADLIEMFKMLRGKSCPSFDSMFERSRNLSTRGHSVKLMKHHCTTDLRKYFFSERVIDRWNMLTEDCVSSSTINEFKGKLTRIRNSKMGFLMDQ